MSERPVRNGDSEREDGELSDDDGDGEYYGFDSPGIQRNDVQPPTTAKKRVKDKQQLRQCVEQLDRGNVGGTGQSGLRNPREDSDEISEEDDHRESRDRHRRKRSRRSRSPSMGPSSSRMIKPPEFPKDIASSGKLEAWLDWKRVFLTSMELAGAMSQRTKANYLTLFGGSELRQIITLRGMLPRIDEVPERFRFFDKLVASLELYFREMSDPTIDVVAFMNASQGSGESAREFEIRLRRTADRCQNKPGEDMIKTRFIQGMQDREMARQACIEAMDLNMLVTRATRQEAFGQTKSQVSFDPWSASDPSATAAAVTFGREKKHERRHKQDPSRSKPWAQRDGRPGGGKSLAKGSCKNCGLVVHRFGSCPALEKSCNKCGKTGHFERVCRASVNAVKIGGGAPDGKPKNYVDEIAQFQAASTNGVEHMVKCLVGSAGALTFMIDSGADVNILAEKEWNRLGEKMQFSEAFLYDINYKPSGTVTAYAAQTELAMVCSFKAWIEAADRVKPRAFETFYVVKNGERSLLGRQAAMKMKLLKVGLEVNAVEIKKPEPFPSMPNCLIEFDIDDTVPPTSNAYCNIPAAFREAACARLEQMEQEDIIERVTSSPRWISGLSAVPKGKKDFRLVVNMKGPNRAIRRQFHKLPTNEEIRHKLAGARWFTKLDLKSAFHHLKLGKRSREMTNFLSTNGMYRYKRLVFGVNCAPEVFQREMERVLQGIEGVIVFIDDILVFAQTIDELRRRTEQVLAALALNNLSLNVEKCEYEKTSLSFLGHQLSADGMNIEKTKIKDVETFREPRTVSELKSFLGLASYVSSYIPRFSDLTTPLRKAIVGNELIWGSEQKAAFIETKNAIINSTTTQGFFDNSDATTLYTDASPEAVGAVLTQTNKDGKERIISFASKTLTATEKRYAQTQREALGIVWAVEHFYYYLLGRRFKIKTDAQGVAFIFRREKDSPKRAMSRAEGWALRLSAYDYEIEYVKGELNIADPSSRLHEGEIKELVEEKWLNQIANIQAEAPGIIFDDDHITAEELRFRSERDEELIEVKESLETGVWSEALSPYKAVRDELYEHDGVLMRCDVAVVPRILRPKMLNVAHKGHPGATSMKSILRNRVWWPMMQKQAEDWVRTCQHCTLTSRRNQPVPMMRSELPNAPWDRLAIDFNGPYERYGGVMILVIVDSYSRYLIARPVRSTDFASLRMVFDDVFETLGYPSSMKSDNGSPFNSGDYKNYCSARGIKVLTSTPLHPQQNGQVERYMQIVNKSMQISMESGKDYRLGLKATIAAHNSAVNRTTGAIPEEIMFGRRLRRGLPLLAPATVVINDDQIRQKDWTEKMGSKAKEDAKRGAKDTSIEVGDKVVLMRTVRVKGDTRFGPTPFTVIGKNRGDLEVRADDGRTFRRSVTMAKKLFERNILADEDIAVLNPKSPVAQDDRNEAQVMADGIDLRDNRPKRATNRPGHLKDFVMAMAKSND